MTRGTEGIVGQRSAVVYAIAAFVLAVPSQEAPSVVALLGAWSPLLPLVLLRDRGAAAKRVLVLVAALASHGLAHMLATACLVGLLLRDLDARRGASTPVAGLVFVCGALGAHALRDGPLWGPAWLVLVGATTALVVSDESLRVGGPSHRIGRGTLVLASAVLGAIVRASAGGSLPMALSW